MQRSKEQKTMEFEKIQTLEEIIISKSMNGWILQYFQQRLKKRK